MTPSIRTLTTLAALSALTAGCDDTKYVDSPCGIVDEYPCEDTDSAEDSNGETGADDSGEESEATASILLTNGEFKVYENGEIIFHEYVYASDDAPAWLSSSESLMVLVMESALTSEYEIKDGEKYDLCQGWECDEAVGQEGVERAFIINPN